MPERSTLLTSVSMLLLLVTAGHAQRGPAGAGPSALAGQVRAAETAFARSMAERNAAAFAALVGDEAVFFGGQTVMRGKSAVVAGWTRFFDGPSAPFSWKPAEVEVLASGTLGFTSGPVYDPQGQRIGTFNSVWQRQSDGSWKVIFDKGCPPCDCSAKP